MNKRTNLSDAETRRDAIVEAAVTVFAERGYGSTPVAEVAAKAGISQAYVFKLFPTKEQLFLAAIARCYERIEATMAAAGDAATDRSPGGVLDAMGDAYARLIADRDLLMLQVHAQGATDMLSVRDAVRDGMARVLRLARQKSGADAPALQKFIAWGQLCHLVVTLDIVDAEDDWARILTAGLRHY